MLKTLDLLLTSSPLIRWALVSVLTLVLGVCIWLWVKNNALTVNIALLKKENVETWTALQIQNEAVKRLGEQTAAQKEVMQSAIKQASKIAVETKDLLEGITDIPLGETCDEKVTNAYKHLYNLRRVRN